MREILFRGKTKEGEWVEGDVIHYAKNDIRILEQNYSYWDIPYYGYEIDPTTLGQFTNTLDVNRKKIFKDDRVKVNWLAELGITELDCESIGVVKWNEFQARWVVVFDKTYTRHIGDGVYEVEEIELLNTKDDDDYSISFEVLGTIHDKLTDKE